MYNSKDIKLAFKTLKINISFWFVACVCLMFLMDKANNSLMSVISIISHESAHIFVLILFGGRLERIDLTLCEMNILAKKDNLTLVQKFLVESAGILINLILFVLLKSVNKDFANVNLIIACFQSLPISSLDGDKILETVGVYKNIRKIISIILCFVLSILGFFILLQTKFNFSILAISLYLLFVSCIKDES